MATMPDNGLRAYGFHADEAIEATRSLRANVSVGRPAEGLTALDLTQASPESVARQYLGNAFSSDALPSLTLPGAEDETQFTLRKIDESPFKKKTRTVRFRQSVNHIPVHGSMAMAE